MNSEIQNVFLNQANVPKTPQEFFTQAGKYQEIMMMYHCAMREVKTKLEVLNDEFQIRSQRNPIEFIKYRIKKPDSTLDKLSRRGLDISLESIVENINDIAGIRVICPFIEDIYFVSDMLIQQDDIILIQRKDYIKNPKPNGYRSLHLVVEIPVYFSSKKQSMRVEVQIRTIAMDFWASLEHQIHYKKDDDSPGIIQDLKECADIIASTDLKMQNIQKQLLK